MSNRDDVTKTVESKSTAQPASANVISLLQYPLEDQLKSQQRRYGAQISFQLVQIKPVEVKGGGGALVDAAKKASTTVDEQGLVAASANALRAAGEYIVDKTSEAASGVYDYVAGTSDTAETKSEVAGTPAPTEDTSDISVQDREETQLNQYIKLYLPVSFTVNDSLNYSDTDLGTLGATALGVMNAGGSATKAISAGLREGLKSIGDFASGAATGDMARVGLLRAAKLPGIPEELRAATSIAGAVTLNPNTRAMFKGVGANREFTFQFKFLPKSKDEAEMVKQIIKKFRTHAYPISINAGGISVGYKYPELFNISIKYNGRNIEGEDGVDVGTKIKNCFLKTISTNYNSSAMSFHADGNPTEFDMTLTFVEERTLTRKDIEEGF